MRYELMLPHQIRHAIEARWPAVLPVGVLEYHGEHLAVGMDMLVVTSILSILDREMDLVVLPPFPYGASSYAVAGPEGNGSIQVDAGRLLPVAQDLFRSLLRIGFRNIHFFIHHQTENFAAGMPTDLAFKLAARQAIFSFVEVSHGEGWWGDKSMADYYSQQAAGDDPFGWIKGHPLMTPDIINQYSFDHAGRGETSLMMALAPEAVDITKLRTDQWYAASAADASEALGMKGRDLILAHVRSVLRAR
jgi:creatinine amidohydrolase/Fe(II)-dependent formamide hydrolase-like protein